MNVMEDAHDSSTAARPRRAGFFFVALLGASVAASAAARWPPAPLPLWQARLPMSVTAALLPSGVSAMPTRSGSVLHAATGARVRGALERLAASRDPATDQLLATARDWQSTVLARGVDAAPEPLDEREACAATLLARAEMLAELSVRLPEPYVAAASVGALSPTLPLLAANQDVAMAAAAGDPFLLDEALARAQAAELKWFASGVPAREAATAVRGRAWRKWQSVRIASLRSLALAALADAPAERVARVQSVLPSRLAGRASDAGAMLGALARGGDPVRVGAVERAWPVWGAWLAFTAALGALLAALLARLVTRGERRSERPRRAAPARALRVEHAPVAGRTRRLEPSRVVFEAPRDPAHATSPLHVVAGPSVRQVARGVLELAAHPLSRGERVLVVETSPRLRLHAVLGREARWGLAECLTADMPVLGLVQYGGQPGLYFLAHGAVDRTPRWSALGRLLDDVEPHFAHVVLALDRETPGAVGDALRGRALEGWWADSVGRVARATERFGDRLSIAFSGMDLSNISDPSLEGLMRRVSGLTTGAPVLVQTPVWPAPEPVRPPHAPAEPEPVILDCDLQIQARLRFLAWMRRVEKESRRDLPPALEAEPALRG